MTLLCELVTVGDVKQKTAVQEFVKKWTGSLIDHKGDQVVNFDESLLKIDKPILDVLLFDRTTRKNIIWATDEYAALGAGYEFSSEIKPMLIGSSDFVQPRLSKTETAQADRTKDKAEVFTPSWISNKQNNLVDAQWFKRDTVFNIEKGTTWETVNEKVSFDGTDKNWKQYVDSQRMEVSCGEAPYLVSRYDTVTGSLIPLMNRVGILDRKMRIVQENTTTADEWLTWSQRAFESVYAYEYQGDNLLLARRNLLYSYEEYYEYRFGQRPGLELLKKIAQIISWNIWQMDGIKGVIPGSCKPMEEYQLSLFDFIDGDDELADDNPLSCPGCRKGNILLHTGIYCRIMDWRSKHSLTYVSMVKGGDSHDCI